jgi:hypothetical protein
MGEIRNTTKDGKVQLRLDDPANPDWWAKCRKCGKIVVGTIPQLKEHNCGIETSQRSEPPKADQV